MRYCTIVIACLCALGLMAVAGCQSAQQDAAQSTRAAVPLGTTRITPAMQRFNANIGLTASAVQVPER